MKDHRRGTPACPTRPSHGSCSAGLSPDLWGPGPLFFFCRGAALLRPFYAFAALRPRMVSQDRPEKAGVFQEGTTSVP